METAMETSKAASPDIVVDAPIDEVSTRQTEIDSTAKDMRMVALRCQDMPEVTRETRLIRKTVSDGAKNIMSGLDSSQSECQKQLLDILDDGESSLVAMKRTDKPRCSQVLSWEIH